MKKFEVTFVFEQSHRMDNYPIIEIIELDENVPLNPFGEPLDAAYDKLEEKYGKIIEEILEINEL